MWVGNHKRFSNLYNLFNFMKLFTVILLRILIEIIMLHTNGTRFYIISVGQLLE